MRVPVPLMAIVATGNNERIDDYIRGLVRKEIVSSISTGW